MNRQNKRTGEVLLRRRATERPRVAGSGSPTPFHQPLAARGGVVLVVANPNPLLPEDVFIEYPEHPAAALRHGVVHTVVRPQPPQSVGPSSGPVPGASESAAHTCAGDPAVSAGGLAGSATAGRGRYAAGTYCGQGPYWGSSSGSGCRGLARARRRGGVCPGPSGAGPSASLRESSRAPGCGTCLLYTSPSPRDLSTSRMPSSA